MCGGSRNQSDPYQNDVGRLLMWRQVSVQNLVHFPLNLLGAPRDGHIEGVARLVHHHFEPNARNLLPAVGHRKCEVISPAICVAEADVGSFTRKVSKSNAQHRTLHFCKARMHSVLRISEKSSHHCAKQICWS